MQPLQHPFQQLDMSDHRALHMAGDVRYRDLKLRHLVPIKHRTLWAPSPRSASIEAIYDHRESRDQKFDPELQVQGVRIQPRPDHTGGSRLSQPPSRTGNTTDASQQPLPHGQRQDQANRLYTPNEEPPILRRQTPEITTPTRRTESR